MMASFRGLRKLSGFGGNFDRGDRSSLLFDAKEGVGPNRDTGVTTEARHRIAELEVIESRAILLAPTRRVDVKGSSYATKVFTKQLFA
jgi:hypothetical protein